MSPHPLARDLDHVLEHTAEAWRELRGQRVFLTGGTGFVGTWLTESLAWANEHAGAEIEAVLLTRHPEAFRRKAPHAAGQRSITLLQGEAQSFAWPEGRFELVIHAATEGPSDDPAAAFERDVAATRRVLEFARTHGTERFLFTSSGAVYGKQPAEITNLPEEYLGAPDPLDAGSGYAQAKRASEWLCAGYARRHGLGTKIARLFAFVGPHLPLEAQYAAGNFVRDALGGGPIRIAGDGTAERSYLYAADLAAWLWTILAKGAAGRAWNVGSGERVSIAQLAQAVVKSVAPGAKIEIAQRAVPGAAPQRYVPSVERARRELGLEPRVALEEGIRRTFAWASRERAMARAV